jgi:hypothetical protein
MFHVEHLPATGRSIRAVWTSEAADDLRAFHSLDAEEQLATAIAREVALEIDKELTDNLHVPCPEDRVEPLKTWSGSVGFKPRTVPPKDGPPTSKPSPPSTERLLTGTEKFLQRIKQDPE